MTGPEPTGAAAGYPLLLDLAGRRVLVAGAGHVAARRIPSLLAAGAHVVVVAPEIRGDVERLAVQVVRRPVSQSDLGDCWLAIACTDDPRANAAVASWAERAGVFCVRADLATGGTARTPAVTRHGAVTVAVSAGDDPGRARDLRNAIALALDTGELAAAPARPAVTGSVALVGGGPGDPELITVRGRRIVGEADVVVVDRLAPRALLDQLRPEVEVVECGKSARHHTLSQSEINDVLVTRAKAGKRVARLKGGDPFVFGRGGEEWLACVAAGVAVEVVPGVTSALAAPALAGIPVTHRQVAGDFIVVSGHLDPHRSGGGGVDWEFLAHYSGTIVLLMGMDRLNLIADALIAGGRDSRTPAAVVHRVSWPTQRIVRAPLVDLARAAATVEISAPAVVVIGDVVDVLEPDTP